uniref:Uncharacterized protein n=1 Tax=Anguilla anguilla TaxID=7936 RepID=A0A0E9XZM5_ANGAN
MDAMSVLNKMLCKSLWIRMSAKFL